MKQAYSSSNKENFSIKFIEFPGNVENKKKKSSLKNIISIIFISIIIIFLFIFSSILNERFLYGNDKKAYNTVNTFKGNFAYIKPDEQEALLKKIGFDTVIKREEKLNKKTYQTIYATKENDNKNLLDSISIYYDKNKKVFYLNINLFYDVKDFSISNTVVDCNSIINNYVNIRTNKNMISEVKNNDYYYYKDKKTNIKASYMLQKNEDYYMLSINIKK